jgi:endogenous inhibitor of DNA gyrase (YacG/DUF329 family)
VPNGPASTAAEAYCPFTKENSGLFAILARTPPTLDGVLGFADRYGLLGLPSPTSGLPGGGTPLALNPDDFPLVAEGIRQHGHEPGEPFDDGTNWCWKSQIDRLAWFIDSTGPLLPYEGDLSPQEVEEVRTAAGVQVVNSALREMAAPRLRWVAAERSYRLALEPLSLIGALWLQAAASVSDPKTFRRCPTCGRPIEISRFGGARTDAMFCSDACKSRDYRARRAEAVRLRDAGVPVEEIAARLRRTPDRIEKWLR